jgi:hypothetical protein
MSEEGDVAVHRAAVQPAGSGATPLDSHHDDRSTGRVIEWQDVTVEG